MVLVSGEAGVGKSRLLAEIQRRAGKQDFLVLQGHCFEQDISFPYAPLVDLLRTFVMRHPVAETFDLLGPLTGELVKLLPELTQTLNLAPSPALEPEAEKRRLFEALARLFIQLSVSQPLLIILEDIHWSDETSLDFLHVFARRLSDYPILLLASYRREEVSAPLKHLLAQFDRERLAHEVVLEPLARSEVDAMLQAIFALERPVRSEFLDAVHDLSEGNPFFIEEIMGSLIVAGDIFLTERGWDRKPLDELRIPRSVQDAVGRRLERLSPALRELVNLAAVAGRRFDFALLQALTGHREDELLALVKELIAAGLVVEASAEQFAFKHALTREAIYQGLLARERKALHKALAEALMHRHQAVSETHLAELAYHFYEAEVWEQARDYTARAGEQTLSLHAPRAALEHLSRSLEAARRLQQEPAAKLYRLRGLAFETLGDFERALKELEAALELARAAADRQAEWQLLIDLGKLWAARDYAKTGDLFERALTLARAMHDPTTLATSLNRLGSWLVNIGRAAAGLAAHREALALFEALGARAGVAETLDLLGMGSGLYGDAIGAVRYFDRAVPLFRSLAERRGLASSLIGRAVWQSPWFTETTASALGSFEACRGDLEEARALARQIGWSAGEAFAEFAAAQVYGAFGELGAALKHAERALVLATDIGHRQWMTGARCTLGQCYLLALEPRLGRQALEAGLTLAKQLGSALWIGVATAFLARSYLLERDLTHARATLTAALPESEPRNVQERQLLWTWGELALAQGKFGLALQVAEDLLVSVPGDPPEQPIPALLKLKGEALLALGRLDEAEEALQGAKRGVLERQLRPYSWQIHRALARVQRHLRREAQARESFAAAREGVALLAATLDEPRLCRHLSDTALATLPEASPRRYQGGLSPREREVAVLVAQGRSNRDIAEILTIGERTVETHVGNILNKLGFNSRVQVAAWAVDKGLVRREES
jgi:predicted ATPase/DNA-binding CsgD family transcriptional regulator